MIVKARRLSMRSDNATLCLPSEGYDKNEIDIELDDYVKVGAHKGALSESDKTWPKGAPIDYVKVGDMILKKKTPTS